MNLSPIDSGGYALRAELRAAQQHGLGEQLLSKIILAPQKVARGGG